MTARRRRCIVWVPPPRPSGTADIAPETEMRWIAVAALLLTAASCRDYDHTKYNAKQDGLMPADDFAKYGPEQAVAVAVGREYGRAGADTAEAYARRQPSVRSVEVDSMGDRLVVTFASGWQAQVNPITDGTAAAETPGLPK